MRCDYKRAIVTTKDFTAEYIQEKIYALNLELNFVCNGDVKSGNYHRALQCFENTMRVKDDHAFAYYFGAQCCRALHLDEKYRLYRQRYEAVMKKSKFWRQYARQFELPITNVGVV